MTPTGSKLGRIDACVCAKGHCAQLKRAVQGFQGDAQRAGEKKNKGGRPLESEKDGWMRALKNPKLAHSIFGWACVCRPIQVSIQDRVYGVICLPLCLLGWLLQHGCARPSNPCFKSLACVQSAQLAQHFPLGKKS